MPSIGIKLLNEFRALMFTFISKMKFDFKSNPILLIFIAVMILNFALVIFAGVMTRGLFIRSIFFYLDDSFMDFFNSIQYGRDPYGKGVIYPPLMGLLYGIVGFFVMPFLNTGGAPALRLTPVGAMSFFMITTVFLLIGFKLIEKKSDRSKLSFVYCAILLFSYPVLMVVERGNNILYAAVFLGLFLSYYNSNEKWCRYLSYLFLGVSIGIKLFPAIFLLLVFKNREKKELFFAILICTFLLIAPAILLEGSIFSWFVNLSTFSGQEAINVNYDLSGFLNYLSIMFHLNFDVVAVGFILRLIVVSIVALVILFIKNVQSWKLIGLLSLTLLLCGSVSRCYTFIYLLIPLTMFLFSNPKLSILNVWYICLFLIFFVLLDGTASLVPYANTFVWLTADYPLRAFASILLLFTLLGDCLYNQQHATYSEAETDEI